MSPPPGLERILLVHTDYQERGGEEVAFESEAALLESRGHRVTLYRTRNERLAGMAAPRAAATAFWNPGSYRELRRLARRERPALVHFHNTFPLLSPSVHYAAAAEGLPAVQTLHNYRLFCVHGSFFRAGRVCEDCLEAGSLWPGAWRACYRGSRAASAVAASMLTTHRLLGTWPRTVRTWIALSEFAKSKFVEGGIPESRIEIKSNFLADDPGPGAGGDGYALFVGRLSPEKGVETLLAAWRLLGGRQPLKIVGDGTLAGAAAAAARDPAIEYLGPVSRTEVLALMRRAAFLVHPTGVYENMPMNLIEAFASGLPAIVSGHGALLEMVEDGRTGLHFTPGDAEDLARKVTVLLEHPERLRGMSAEARRCFEARYTAERNYERLIEIYRRAVAGPAAAR